MHIPHFIASGLSFGTVAIFIQWLLQSRNISASRKNGRVVLYYPAPIKIGHFIGTALVACGAVLAALDGDRMATMSASTIAFIFFCCSIELYTKRIEFDDEEILIYFAWLQPKRIPWTDVISLEPQTEWDLLLKTRSHGKLTLLPLLVGLKDLRAAADKNIK